MLKPELLEWILSWVQNDYEWMGSQLLALVENKRETPDVCESSVS